MTWTTFSNSSQANKKGSDPFEIRRRAVRMTVLKRYRLILLGGSACMMLAIPSLADERMKKLSIVRNSNFTVKKEVLSFREIGRQNLVTQGLDYSCGAAAIATVAKYFWGDNVSELDFIKIALQILSPEEFRDRQKNGLTMEDLKNIAIKAQYFSTVGRLKFDQLEESKVPLIVGLDVEGYKHFVVIRGTDDNFVYIADSIRGNLRLKHSEFKRQWQKNLVLVVAKRTVPPPKNAPLSVRKEDQEVKELQYQTIRRSYLIPTF
ncbi:MAG: cysteine peptidase family C39 domain-containing protein [Planctomycetota bacterium]|nr:cysteine peptidase family C39 domain-containing protein [Planctomycetota bacterium]